MVATEAAGWQRMAAAGAGQPAELPRWRAELALRFAAGRRRTVIASRHQRGPLLVQRPFYPEENDACHCYLVHPPGGIVGGDDLDVRIEVGNGAHALVTTPGATRWYYSSGRQADVRQDLRVAAGATLEWLPQETLLFNGARARQATRVHLEDGARFCSWEIVGLGRPACGERFEDGSIDFRFELLRHGRPVLLERLRGSGGMPGLRGHAACATFVATSACAAALERAREVLGAARNAVCAATLIDGTLIGRGLASNCEPLTLVFGQLWTALRPLLLGRVAVPPRVWQT